MDVKIDEYGAFDLEELESKEEFSYIKNDSKFIYKNEIYYIKQIKDVKNLYNELIAEELAKDFGILTSQNYLSFKDGEFYILSKSIEDSKSNLILMSNIIDDNENNLEDIWLKISKKCSKQDNIERFMNEIINMFLFDVLIGNIDRHTDNYGIFYNNEIFLAPLFDNSEMLSLDSINLGYYSLGVTREDRNTNGEYNLLEKFLNYSDTKYLELLKSKLWIIEDENMQQVFERVEKKLNKEIVNNIKLIIIQRMKKNLSMINRTISKFEVKKNEYKL